MEGRPGDPSAVAEMARLPATRAAGVRGVGPSGGSFVRWLGERLITRCITLDAESGLTTAQAQKIIESLVPDVPIEQRIGSASGDGAVLRRGSDDRQD